MLTAAKHGHVNVTKYLLENGAIVNYQDCDGCLALHWCAYDNRIKTAELVLKHHADINCRAGTSQATPLMCAAVTGRLEMCRFLVENGAKTNLKDKNGRTALQVSHR